MLPPKSQCICGKGVSLLACSSHVDNLPVTQSGLKKLKTSRVLHCWPTVNLHIVCVWTGHTKAFGYHWLPVPSFRSFAKRKQTSVYGDIQGDLTIVLWLFEEKEQFRKSSFKKILSVGRGVSLRAATSCHLHWRRGKVSQPTGGISGESLGPFLGGF